MKIFTRLMCIESEFGDLNERCKEKVFGFPAVIFVVSSSNQVDRDAFTELIIRYHTGTQYDPYDRGRNGALVMLSDTQLHASQTPR